MMIVRIETITTTTTTTTLTGDDTHTLREHATIALGFLREKCTSQLTFRLISIDFQ